MGVIAQLALSWPPYWVKAVSGSRSPMTVLEGRSKKRVTALCESVPPPGRSVLTRRPARVPRRPKVGAAYRATRPEPKLASALPAARVPAPGDPLARGAEGGNAGEELHRPAEGVAAVLRARRAPHHLDPLERLRLHHVEERADAAPLGRGRVAHAVQVDVDLGAGQPAHEDAGDRGARALDVEAHLLARRLGQHGLHAQRDVLLADDVHPLGDVPERVGAPRGGGDGDLVLERLGLQAHGQRRPPPGPPRPGAPGAAWRSRESRR